MEISGSSLENIYIYTKLFQKLKKEIVQIINSLVVFNPDFLVIFENWVTTGFFHSVRNFFEYSGKMNKFFRYYGKTGTVSK